MATTTVTRLTDAGWGAVAAFETGQREPTAAELEVLADLYDVRLDWLANDAPPAEPVSLRGLEGLEPADVAKIMRSMYIVRRR